MLIATGGVYILRGPAGSWAAQESVTLITPRHPYRTAKQPFPPGSHTLALRIYGAGRVYVPSRPCGQRPIRASRQRPARVR